MVVKEFSCGALIGGQVFDKGYPASGRELEALITMFAHID